MAKLDLLETNKIYDSIIQLNKRFKDVIKEVKS